MGLVELMSMVKSGVDQEAPPIRAPEPVLDLDGGGTGLVNGTHVPEPPAIVTSDSAFQQKQMGSRRRGKPCRNGAALRRQDVLGAQERAVKCVVRSEVRHKIAGVGFRDIIKHDDLISDVPGETAHRPDGQPDLIRHVTREDQNGNKRCLALSLSLPIALQKLGAFFGKDSHKIPGCQTRADPGKNR